MMPCKCNNHVDDDGIGRCRKRDTLFNQQFSCYVMSPSSCIDAEDIPNNNDMQKSAIACEDKNEGKVISTKYHNRK